MVKYSIGVDFGLCSGVAVLVDVTTGAKLAEVEKVYSHGITEDGDEILQHPMDYLEVLQEIIPKVIAMAGVSKEDVVGLGIDFATSTALPVMKDGTPLCFFNEYAEEKGALVRLASHNSREATKLNEIAHERDEAFLSRFGGKVCNEGLVPLVWKILEDYPKVYETADYFMEAADWIIWQLTGVQTRNSYSASLGAMWSKNEGYPDEDFFAALNPNLANLATDKLNCQVSLIGAKAGNVAPFVAEAIGLSTETSVAVGSVKEASILPALAIGKPGDLLVNIEETTDILLMSDSETFVSGICGTVSGGAEPDFYIYKAAQTSLESQLKWFTENLANKECLSIDAGNLKAGESGLIALDWIGGNTSILSNDKLSGLFLGITPNTKSHEMYRALIEASAFGLKTIINNFNAHGVPVNEIYMTGDFANNNPVAIQIFADVLNLPVKVKCTNDAAALGSAVLGALAADCYDSLNSAAKAMGIAFETVYTPDADENYIYNKLFSEYTRIHDYFGRGANSIMKRLSLIKAQTVTETPAVVEIPVDDSTDEAMAELFDAIAEVAESVSYDESDEEILVPDLEVPQDVFEDLLGAIDEASDDVLVEATEEVEMPQDVFDDLLDVIEDSIDDEEVAESTEDPDALAAENFAEILDEQLENDNIDYDALEDLAKLDGVAEEGDVVAEASFDPFVDISLSYEVKDLMEKYGADPDSLNSTFIADDVKELMDKYGELDDSIRGYQMDGEVADLMSKYEYVDASVEGTFEVSDLEDELAEIVDAAIEEVIANEANETTEEVITETVDITEEVAEEAVDVIEEITAEAIEPMEEVITETVEASEDITAEVVEATEDIAAEVVEATEDATAEVVEATEDTATEVIEATEDAAAEASEDNEEEEMIPVPTLSSEFPEFSATKVRTNTSIPDDFWRY